MALTDTEIRRSKFADKPYRLTDGRGLYLQITKTGGKLWRWKYRFEGKEKLMALGQYPDVPLADARDRLAAAAGLWRGPDGHPKGREGREAGGRGEFLPSNRRPLA